MKILFISNLYPPNVIGGYERLCHAVAEAMVTKGHQVDVLTSSYGIKSQDYKGQTIERSLKLFTDDVDIYKAFKGSSDQLEEYRAFNNKTVEDNIHSINPDIIFVWNLYFLNSDIIYKIRESGKRTVFLLTDNWLVLFLNPTFWTEYFAGNVLSRPGLTQRIRSKVSGLFKNREASKTILEEKAVFPSVFMRDLYAKAGLKFNDYSIIPHGVHLPEKSISEYADRSTLVSPGHLSLLFAGRVVQIKGVHTIIDALPGIVRSLPRYKVSLTIVGDCSDLGYTQSLKSMIRKKGLEGFVKFIPAVEESRLFSLFQDHDIYLFPSLYEPFSLTLIHALHAGIPTIGSDAGGNPEIIDNGRNGLLFQAEDSPQLVSRVVQLANDSGLRRDISLKARRVADYYTFDRMVAQIEDYLREC